MLRSFRVLGFCLLFLLSCSDHPMEKNIRGKWLINDYRVNVNQPQFEQDRLQEEIQKIKKNSYFIFHANYEYEVNLNGNIEKGKWRIDPKTQKLSTQKSNTNTEISLNIDTLNTKTFVFSSTKDSITTQVSLIKEISK